MLRANVDDILIVAKDLAVDAGDVAVLVFHQAVGVVLVLLVVKTQRVLLGVVVIVLAQWVSHPVVAQEEAAHVGVVDKHDAEEVVHLALLIVGHAPQVAHAVQAWRLAVVGSHLHVNDFLCLGIGQVVHHSQFLFPVNTNECCEVVEVKLVLERLCKSVPLGVGHGNQQELAAGVTLSLGTQLANFFLYI